MEKYRKILSLGLIVIFLLLTILPFTDAKFSENNISDKVIEQNHRTNEKEQKFEYLRLAQPLNHPNRKILRPEDEGPHFHRLLSMREWWYYNVIFDKPDSELKNWSALISFNHV